VRRVLVLLVVVAAIGGGYLGAAALDGGRNRLPDAAGAVDRLRDRAGSAKDRVRRERSSLREARCPAGLSGCRSVTGRVVYVESVDPDGDGDLHVVIVDAASITAPGLTAVDIKPALRPRRDPRPGDRVTAAGQVQTGSHEQSQIHASVFRVAGG
jgi:hypothetical protein